MSSWPMVALGEVCDVVSGGTPKTSETSYWDGDIPWVTPKDLSGLEGDYIDEPTRFITAKGLRSSSAVLLPAESVLLSSRAPIGLLAINTVPMATNQGFKSLIPDRTQLEPHYLVEALKFRLPDLLNQGNGATFKEVSKAAVERFEIPLPPLESQHRIASALRRTKTTLSATTSRARKLSAVKASQFNRVVSLADSKVSLNDLVSIRAGNSLPSGSEFIGQSGGSLLLRVSDLNRPQNSRHVSVAARWSPDEANRSTSAPAGSVVFPKRGGAIGTNKKRILGRTAQLDPNLMGLAPKDDRCPTEWLAAWLDTIDLSTLANGSSVPQINKKDVKDLMVPVPSAELLQSFRQLSQQIDHLQNTVQQQIDSARELYESLQYRAFRRKL